MITMANRNRKTRRSKSSRTSSRRQRASALEAGLLGKTRKPREDRHILVALTMASLIAGLLFVINFDRSTHSATAQEMGKGTSLHGWPFIYLHREFESLPAYLIATRISEWPIPAVKGETRNMNYVNLGLDILIGSIVVVLSYFVFRTIVFRYDQWKKTWA